MDKKDKTADDQQERNAPDAMQGNQQVKKMQIRFSEAGKKTHSLGTYDILFHILTLIRPQMNAENAPMPNKNEPTKIDKEKS
jgi:hypothetical protein